MHWTLPTPFALRARVVRIFVAEGGWEVGEDGKGNRFCSKGSDPKISIINGRKRARESED